MFLESFERPGGSLGFTVVSFFPQRAKSRNYSGGNGFPASKVEDVEFQSNVREGFFGERCGTGKFNVTTESEFPPKGT